MPGTLTPQNLVKQVTAESVIRPAGFYQSIILDTLTVLSAGVLGYAYFLYLGNRLSPLLLAVAFGAFGLLAVFGTLLGKSLPRRISVTILEGVALVLPFYDSQTQWLSVVATLIVLLLIWGEILARRELAGNLQVSFWRVTHPFLKKVATAAILAGILLYLPHFDAERSFVSEATFETLFDWAAGTGGKLYPEIRFNGTAEMFAEGVARLELQKSQLFRALAPAAQESMVQASGAQVLAGLGKTLGADVRGSEPFFSLLYRLLKGWYRTAAEKTGDQFLIIWAVALFLILRGVGTIAYFVLAFVGFLIYQLLLAANVIVIVGESQVHEVIEYA